MCLDKVNNIFSGIEAKVYTGWKVFDIHPGRLEFESMHYKNSWHVPLNQWIIQKNFRTNHLPEYPLGFHIFDTLKDAMTWTRDNKHIIRQVWYKGILAKGYQRIANGLIKITVAKSLYVRGRRKRPEAPK